MATELKPSLFYGGAIMALCGVAAGLVLHGSWAAAGPAIGPQILFSQAQAATPIRSSAAVSAQDDDLYADATPLKDEYVTPTPLPVVRLAPAVQTAAVDEERTDADAAVDDDDAQTSADTSAAD